MAQPAADEVAARHRRRREKRKRKSRKRERLVSNLLWLAGGLLIGLPFLAMLLYVAARL